MKKARARGQDKITGSETTGSFIAWRSALSVTPPGLARARRRRKTSWACRFSKATVSGDSPTSIFLDRRLRGNALFPRNFLWPVLGCIDASKYLLE